MIRSAFAVHTSPYHPMVGLGMVWNDAVVASITLGEGLTEAAWRASLPTDAQTSPPPDDGSVAALVGALTDHLEGQGQAAAWATTEAGTPFQRQVWAAIEQIPRGQTRTYTELAGMVGRPAAVRAVAAACATNPRALLTPCHRVVPADGSVGEYRWGKALKRTLLEREGAI